MKSGRPAGPDRLKGTLKPWRLETIFGAVVVRGILVLRRIAYPDKLPSGLADRSPVLAG